MNIENIGKNDKIVLSEDRSLIKESRITYSYEVFDEFIVVDTETTGLDCVESEIIEISALRYKYGKIVDKFETLINPGINIPNIVTEITGINNEMVLDKPSICEVLPKFINFIGDMPLVAHNAKFDIRFLNASLIMIDSKISNKVIDTLTISRKIYPKLENYKLTTIKDFFKMDIESHRASLDCIVAARIYLDYCDMKL